MEQRAIQNFTFLNRPGMVRLQINVIPVPDGQIQAMRSRTPELPFSPSCPDLRSGEPI